MQLSLAPLPDSLRQELQSRLDLFVGVGDDNRNTASLAIRLNCNPDDDGVELVAAGSSAIAMTSPQFLAYSITKSLLAVLILQLVQEQRCELLAPISRWLPSVPNASAITVQHLLTHTAGLPDYGALPAYQSAVRYATSQPWGFDQYAAHTYEQGRLFEPGQGWAYSNPGYMLLKRIVEVETGESLASLVDRRIARPLGLHHMHVVGSTADLHELAPAYSRGFGTTEMPVDVRTVYHPGWVAHGVVASTARDITTFYHQLFCGALLPLEAVRDMTTPVPVPNAPAYYGDAGYGLGLMIATTPRHGLHWGHNGGGPGYHASAFHSPTLWGQGATVCAMYAGDDGLPEQLVFDVLDLLGQIE